MKVGDKEVAFIINLTIVECKLLERNFKSNVAKNNKSNHSGM